LLIGPSSGVARLRSEFCSPVADLLLLPLARRASVTTAMTTNCKPVSAAADEPTMT